ncbi:MAG: hypothetical protein ABR593_12035 [Candidatus Limnocylindria bacterium]
MFIARIFTAALLVLVLSACVGAGVPRSSVSSPQPVPALPSAAPSTEPSDAAEPSPTASAPTESGEHAATGLALVQFPGGNDDPASQVFVAAPDGNLRQVTGMSGTLPGAAWPVWSPDRSQITFQGPKVGSPGVKGLIGVVNADGTGERYLSEGTNPRWSPDGTRLLVEEVDDVTSEPPSMFIVDVASDEVTDIGQGFNPQWLGDGEVVSFNRVVEQSGGAFASVLFTMSLDGGEPVEMAPETDAFWSPDGSSVLFVREGNITLAAADGSNPMDLATGFAPVWSPDGTRVVFAYDHDQDGTPILAVVDLEGSEIWSGVSGTTPTWSPDGSRIAIEVPYPEASVQVLDAATGELLWETVGMHPAWSN